jgi:hypothetical protein
MVSLAGLESGVPRALLVEGGPSSPRCEQLERGHYLINGREGKLTVCFRCSILRPRAEGQNLQRRLGKDLAEVLQRELWTS